MTVSNGSGLFASCSPFETDIEGLFLSQAWLAIGPFFGPGCEGSLDNQLGPSFIGCEYPEVGDELTEGYDPFEAASDGVHEYAPVTDDGEPIWYAFDDGTNNGDQDFNLGTPEPDNVVQYAVTYIEYTGDEDLVDLNLCIGSDDSIDIWINGERVYFTSSLLANWDKQDGEPGDLQFFKAFEWDGEQLTRSFQIDFLAQELGAPHQMRFGAYALYGKQRPRERTGRAR